MKTRTETKTPPIAPLSRRKFIKGAAAAVTLPFFMPHSVFGANNRVNLAWIGPGNQGTTVLRGVPSEMANIVALCDVDDNPWGNPRELFPNAKFYKDFRVMLDEMDDEIDAVGIATPDHTHFAAAYMAISRGKHVFCEKPLTHSAWEARTLMNLARERGVKTQMANQGHASEGIRLFKEWYQAGLIGDVKEIIGWTDRPHRGWGFRPGTAEEYPPAQEVPDRLDWDLWLGPVTEPIAYNQTFHNPGQREQFWRHWWAFGTGSLGDIGCHTLDAPYWALELDYPRRIDVEMQAEPNPIHKVDGSIVTYHFDLPNGKPPVEIKWYEGPLLPRLPEGFGLPETARDMDRGGGLVMVGESGVIGHTFMRPYSPRLYPDERWDAFRADESLRPPRTLPRVQGGIMADFLRAIQEDGTPTSNFDYSAKFTEVMHLGTLATRTNKSIEYDAENMRIPGNPEAEALLKREARPGWDIADLT